MTAILYSHFTSYSYTFSPLFMSSYDLLWLYNGFISLVVNHPYTVIALGVIKLVADSIYLKLLLLLLGLLVFSKEERGLPFFYLSAVVLTIVALVDLDMETELLYQGDSLQVVDEAVYVGLISTDSHEYIPWHNTQALANGIEGLNSIYRSLEF